MVFYQQPKSKRLAKKQSSPSGHSTSGHFGTLSHEVALQIFEYLEPRDLFTARQLCSHLKPVADEVISKKITQLNLRPCEQSIRIAKEICNHPIWSQGITELVILECAPYYKICERIWGIDLGGEPLPHSLYSSATYCRRPWPFVDPDPLQQRRSPQFAKLLEELAKLRNLTKLSFARNPANPSFNRAPAVTPCIFKERNSIEPSSERRGITYDNGNVLVGLLTAEALSIHELEVRGGPNLIAMIGSMLHDRYPYSPTFVDDESTSFIQDPALSLRKLTISIMMDVEPSIAKRLSEEFCVSTVLSQMYSFKLETVVLRLCSKDGDPVPAPIRPMLQYCRLGPFFRTHQETLKDMFIDNLIFIAWLNSSNFAEDLAEMVLPHQLLPPNFRWRLNVGSANGLTSRHIDASELSEIAQEEGLELQNDERGAFWDIAKGSSLMRARQVKE